MSASGSAERSVDVPELFGIVQAILRGNGVPDAGAAITTDSLVSAEIEGISSHGVALLPLYIERLEAGGVSAGAVARIVEDFGGLVTMTADHGLGQVSAMAAVELAQQRAAEHGLCFVSVRQAFHFGAAAFWAKRLAREGMVGMALSNTRPLMPAPGGAQRVVGNNPMAVAFPSDTGETLVVDMAMSATAMGRIRLAEGRDEPIPLGWATDAQGTPTTSAADAIKGMLLPAAGPKGFGLAVVIDLLCGALSAGSVGAAVKPLYGNASEHYDCSHAFLAIDANRVNAGKGVGAAVALFADAIRESTKALGTMQIFAPGDLERAQRSVREHRCPLPSALIEQLNTLAARVQCVERLNAHTIV